MIILVTNKDTLDSLSHASVSNLNMGLLILIVTITIGLIVIFYLKIGTKKKSPINETLEKEIPAVTKTKLSSKEKQSSIEIQVGENRKTIQSGLIKKEVIKKEIVKEEKNKSEINKSIEPTLVKVIETIKPEKEEQSKEKYIGYNPINIFAQPEPLNYPYVNMPKPNCVIKFPRKGRSGRKGYKEENFKIYIERYYRSDFQVFDDRFILVKNNPKPFEPDFTLIDENNGINIFLDIEIDEPYEGLNDIKERKPTHYQQSDTNRNNAFKNRGWIVIRFAEIQVHQAPNSCCRFIADVLKSINSKYVAPENLSKYEKLTPLRQWTKEEAEKWSLERYREKYLGIDSFGITINNDEINNIEETDIGNIIEDKVEDDKFIPIVTLSTTSNAKLDKIYSAINSNKYLSFKFDKENTVVKPIKLAEDKLTAFCFVKNRERNFPIYNITELTLKDTYYTLRVAGPTIGLEQITNAVNTAIIYHKLIRMKYTRSSWTNMVVDRETGELMIDRIEAEESIRTINDVQLSINALAQEHIEAYNLNSNYITAYCNKREEQRTFRFDRIGEIEILNI